MASNKQVLINASNLHAGGGIQVASSFINELMERSPSNVDFTLICSTKVMNNLNIKGLNFFKSVSEVNIYGIRRPEAKIRKLFEGYDCCFTIFGPTYFNIPAKKHYCGFAQPWIAYKNNDVYPMLGLLEKITNKLKFSYQELIFRKYEKLIVEHESVKSALLKNGFKNDIVVAHNSCSKVFSDSRTWEEIEDFNNSNCRFKVGFLGRAYRHKNLNILKEVNNILASEYSLEIDFLFSLSEAEMESCGFNDLSNFYSVGELKVTQCPSFYQIIDLLVFPSLLECFSATPLESMKMKTPVLASDRDFITQVYGDACVYFDPTSADSIAKSIATIVKDKALYQRMIIKGSEYIDSSSTADMRTQIYLNMITEN
ncbi:glycosyltransferase [Nitrincola sp.]|uniref:glycosyltransferase n=1 Tax=Nitrincola sp. TaxID=1926584 RepID=UPI003A92796C